MEEPSLDATTSAEVPLTTVVRDTLEKNGELYKIRALIQARVLDILRGGDNSSITKPPSDRHGSASDVLNKLILEYFHWSGLIYSADMLATETGIDHQPPSRINLENFVGDYKKDSPILISLVGEMMNSSGSQC